MGKRRASRNDVEDDTENIMEAIRTLGRPPRESKAVPKNEQLLAQKLRKVRRGKNEAEHDDVEDDTENMMEAVRTLGRLPTESKAASKDEQLLA